MATVSVECSDFLEFQDALQKMRQIDDKIIYMLNTTIPTESFKGQRDATTQCKDLYEQIQVSHKQREEAITKCQETSRNRVKQLKNQRDNGEETPELIKTLRKEQNKLRMLQSELNVEEVVKTRTTNAYYERCRGFYKPESSGRLI
ncbi:hypothetical protein KM043_002356 [Ampulex compressa]|nr:hypothetical protein KM043_002356 [Ampulex compressa]